jgi:FO synthase subunit 2
MMGKGEPDLNLVRSELKMILKNSLNEQNPSENDLETLFLAKGREINVIGQVADIIRRQQVGETITYIINRNINFTNVCSKKCLFCAFSVNPHSQFGYFNTSRQYFKQKIEEINSYPITEVCVQGGIHPDLNFEAYLQILDNLKSLNPQLHIHAYSPQEVFNAAETDQLDIEAVLKEFKFHGLGSLPGTAAEILDDELRKYLCPKKISTSKWVEIIKLAHELGIPTTSTILFGHIENYKHWITHLSIIRRIQIETKGFTEFIPLPFVAENTPLSKNESTLIKKLTKLDFIKFYAVSRLYLGDIFKNIQTSWVKLGLPLAESTLQAGCNDLGGTLFEENITRSAGGVFGQFKTPEQLQKCISRLQRPYCERGTLYNLLC